MMISLTRTNGITVRLDASYDVEAETVEYTVTCDSTRLYFGDFKRAAVLYKSLCEEIKMKCDMSGRLATLDEMYGRKEVA